MTLPLPHPSGLWRRYWLAAVMAAPLALAGCAWGQHAPAAVADAREVPTDPSRLADWVGSYLAQRTAPEWLILGEQHDADAHQALEAAVVRALAARVPLAALVLEMAERGRDTSALPRDADEKAVQRALDWNDRGWPWVRYGPVVMAAVRAGVAVHGGNLPRNRHRAVMADAAWDARLPPERLDALRRMMDTSHCGMLPPSQWAPMARIQIARDDAMADTLWTLRTPGRTVLLVTGSQHARRTQGVPVHLTRYAGLTPDDARLRVVELRATDAPVSAVEGPAPEADAVWLTPAVPPVDHCAGLRAGR